MSSETPATFSRRASALRSVLAPAEALLLLDGANIRYLTGFTGSDAALILFGEGAVLLVDGRYATQARGEAQEAEVFEFRNRVDGIVAVANRRRAAALRFEAGAMSVEEYLRLKEALSPVELIPFSGGSLVMLRAVKDEEEIRCIREAARIAAAALEEVLPLVRPGVTEQEIAWELEYRIRRAGAQGTSFETIVASGRNTALPHARPTAAKIGLGDCLLVDYGAVVEGYRSDETRTYVVGEASERQREVYRLVREAHDRAVAAIRPGMTCDAVDRIARRHLEEAGLGEYFSHGTGHGVGLDIHEAPRLAAGREEVLQPGMVVTIEPGVYLPGVWGIRIEDTVVVKDDGCEVLTNSPSSLTIL